MDEYLADSSTFSVKALSHDEGFPSSADGDFGRAKAEFENVNLTASGLPTPIPTITPIPTQTPTTPYEFCQRLSKV